METSDTDLIGPYTITTKQFQIVEIMEVPFLMIEAIQNNSFRGGNGKTSVRIS